MHFCFDHWEWEDPRLRRKARKEIKEDDGVPRRKVNYAKTCAVILIPSRLEYFDAGIDLWYDKKDLKSSQHQASAELKRIIEENPALTMESAMAYLYQPSVDVYFRDNSNSWSAGGMLNVLVVDKNLETAEDTIKLLRMYQNRWEWHGDIAQSGEKAIKTLKTGARNLDLVFIDENIGKGGGLSFAALMNIFRSVYGEDVFIGCTLSEGSEQVRKDAIKAGCDFMWQRPFHSLLDMLPIILSSRSTRRSRQNSLGNSRNSSSLLLQSLAPGASSSGHASGTATPLWPTMSASSSVTRSQTPSRSNSVSPCCLATENGESNGGGVHAAHKSIGNGRGLIIGSPSATSSAVDNELAERLILADSAASNSSSNNSSSSSSGGSGGSNSGGSSSGVSNSGGSSSIIQRGETTQRSISSNSLHPVMSSSSLFDTSGSSIVMTKVNGQHEKQMHENHKDSGGCRSTHSSPGSSPGASSTHLAAGVRGFGGTMIHSSPGSNPGTSSGTSLFGVTSSSSGSGRISPNHHHPHPSLVQLPVPLPPPPQTSSSSLSQIPPIAAVVVGLPRRRNSHLSVFLGGDHNDSFDKLEGSPLSSPPQGGSSFLDERQCRKQHPPS